MSTVIKSSKVGFPSVPALMVGVVLALTITGCAVNKQSNRDAKIRRNLSASGGGLKQFVGFLPFSNAGILEDNKIEAAFYKKFVDTFRAGCPRVRYQQLKQGKLFRSLTRLSAVKSSRVDNFALSEISRQAGLNAVIAGSFVDIDIRQEKGGMLWFKSDRYLLQVQVETEVYDALTATKALDETIIFEEEVDESVYRQVRSKTGNRIPMVRKALHQIAGDMGEAVCRAMNDVYARGAVVGVEGDRILISSGQKAGIKPGQTLKAYAVGELVQGISGHRFVIPGPKIGEIKTTRVFTDRSEAKIVSGGPVPPGSSVSLRD